MHDTPSVPLSESEAATEARRIIATLYQPDSQSTPTAYRDTTPSTPATTPPVTQPGRPPMSQRAIDASGLMLAGGIASAPLGGATALVLWSLGQVSPVSLAIGAAAPVALVAAVAAAVSRIRNSGDTTGPTTHIYQGPVRQTHTAVHAPARGLIARSRTHFHH